jgi:AcrR family transcriptional regulator
MQGARSKNTERREETRANLIATGRKLFADKGFAATGTEEIAAEAGVTRGALYFHFADKMELFAAVFDQIAREIADRIVTGAQAGDDPISRITLGAAAYIDACCDPTRRRVYLIDGPSVLGAERWHREESRYAGPLLAQGVKAALAAPGTPSFDDVALTRMLDGALVEAARWLAFADDPAELRPRLIATIDGMAERLFRPAV